MYRPTQAGGRDHHNQTVCLPVEGIYTEEPRNTRYQTKVINHCLFDAEGAKVIDRKASIRWIKVAICITKTKHFMNIDERVLDQPPTGYQKKN